MSTHHRSAANVSSSRPQQLLLRGVDLLAGKAPATIAVGAFFAYALSLSRDFMGDGVQFALSIENGSLEQILTPNHMLYPLLGLWFHRLWELVGWQQGALMPLQFLSAAGGAISVGLFYAVARRLLRKPRAALIVTVGFASSHAIWLYSTDAEVVTIPLALSLGVLLLLLRMSGPLQPRLTFVLAALVALTIIVYQTSVFLVPVVVVAFLFSLEQAWKRRIRHIVFFVSAVILLLAATYLSVGYLVLDFRTAQDFINWQFELAQLNLWGQPSLRGVGQGAYAMLRSVAAFGGLGPSDRTTQFLASASTLERIAFTLYYLVVAAVVALPLGLLIRRRKLVRKRCKALAILGCWALLYSVFAIYWVPGDMQFWVPVLVTWWLVVGVLLAEEGLGGESERGPRATRFSFRQMNLLPLLAVVGVLLLIVANAANAILPNRRPPQAYTIAESIAERTSANDLIITTGGDRLFLYVPYFTGRRTISVYHEILHGQGGKDTTLREIEREMNATKDLGGRIYLVGVQPGENVWWDTLHAVGVTREDFRRYNSVPAWSVDGEMILEMLPE